MSFGSSTSFPDQQLKLVNEAVSRHFRGTQAGQKTNVDGSFTRTFLVHWIQFLSPTAQETKDLKG